MFLVCKSFLTFVIHSLIVILLVLLREVLFSSHFMSFLETKT